MNVTIIGTGKMARALSTRFLEGGNNITLIEHTPGKAQILVEELKQIGKGHIQSAEKGVIDGEVVFLAVPYIAVNSILSEWRDQLAGKVLVDITNPINFQKMEPLLPVGSGAEEIAKTVPMGTRVVKAFNTVFAKALIPGQVAGEPLDIFIAGDDAEAKQKVTRLIEAGGLRAIDTGLLIRARQLEALGLLHMAIQSTNNLGYKSSIKVLV